MEHIPTGAILLLLLTDAGLTVALSVLVGGFVARAGGRSLSLGLAIGAVLPILGPVVWGSILLHRRSVGVRRVIRTDRSLMLYVAAAVLLLGASAQVAGMWLPWGHIHGAVEDYSINLDASLVDTMVGAALVLGTAAVVVVGTVLTLFLTVRRRVAAVMVAVSGVWLVLSLDSLILLSALRGATESAADASGNRASVDIGGSSGLWVALAASTVLAVGALTLGWLPDSKPFRMMPLVQYPSTTPVDDLWSPAARADVGQASPPPTWGPLIAPVAPRREDSEW